MVATGAPRSSREILFCTDEVLSCRAESSRDEAGTHGVGSTPWAFIVVDCFYVKAKDLSFKEDEGPVVPAVVTPRKEIPAPIVPKKEVAPRGEGSNKCWDKAMSRPPIYEGPL
ncbi:hypothetical protein BHE74_00004656 [Ensete ventricosum]|nr:hypothetical protein GW17_00022476 [Ensete ventricosum]RWW86565.1 hypothetical protein BHE74_00004656 [Ensete ventricosum]RZS02450.1 hypothetical protein BHM03_00032508 [Ensete ventricosum]